MPNKGKFKILSGSTLKLIAVISMLIDHIALVLGPELEFLTASLLTVGGRDITCYYIMRRIGRLAFPIFCFLITEGFAHTRNPKRYALRLLIFALLSEVPYNLMVGQTLFYTARQNIYFTLLLGLLFVLVHALGKHSRASAYLLVVRYDGVDAEKKLRDLPGYRLKNKTLSAAGTELVAEVRLSEKDRQAVEAMKDSEGIQEISLMASVGGSAL